MNEDRIAFLQRALDQTGGLIASITPEQHSLRTPCENWDVATLVGHVVAGLDNFAAAARGEKPDWSAARPPLEGDWAAAFRSRAGALVDAWRHAAPEAQPNMGLQIVEQAVHSWDIARAIGHPVESLDPEVGEFALQWGRQMLKPEHRGTGAFGTEVSIGDDAPLYDRLAAWFGRDPAGASSVSD